MSKCIIIALGSTRGSSGKQHSGLLIDPPEVPHGRVFLLRAIATWLGRMVSTETLVVVAVDAAVVVLHAPAVQRDYLDDAIVR